jgi:hypothetical protein
MKKIKGTIILTGETARNLRKILYPNLDDSGVEAIIVCLLSQLLVEQAMNNLLYHWLKYEPPIPEGNNGIEDKLYKNITKMDFAKKYSLIEPFFAANFPSEAKDVWKINNLRNDIFHGRALHDAKFKNGNISKGATINKVFETAQCISMQLDKLLECISDRRELSKRWAKRLKEKGEPLI